MCLRFSNDLRADCHDPLPTNATFIHPSQMAKGLAATEFDSSLAPAADPSRKLETQEGGAAICLF